MSAVTGNEHSRWHRELFTKRGHVRRPSRSGRKGKGGNQYW